jgi:hypothetical protein
VLNSSTVVISRQLCSLQERTSMSGRIRGILCLSVVSYYSWNKHPLFDSSRNQRMRRRKQCKNRSDHIFQAVWWSGSSESGLIFSDIGNGPSFPVGRFSFNEDLSSLISAGSILMDSTGTVPLKGQ